MFNLKNHKTIRLDIGCGDNKQQNFVGMDKRKLSGVDIIHDLEKFPYPLPDNCCSVVLASHIFEHVNPEHTIAMFNELWRIVVDEGQLIISLPYAGSPGFWQDPTHCNGFNEATFQYFDPRFPLYNIYKPKPWKIQHGFPCWQVNGNLEVLMNKVGNRKINKKEIKKVRNRRKKEKTI